jgi:protein-S-isoprenylcysteine O-methyltransferase Ste14
MNQPQTIQTRSISKGILRWALRETMGLIMYLPLLFGCAGTWNWPMAWILIALTAGWVIGTAFVTIPRYPELLLERLGPRKGGQTWDTIIIGIVGIMMLVKLSLAGLNIRFGWTYELPFALEVLGTAAAFAGYGLIVWATGSNAYFSMINRIQSERNHQVASEGAYAHIRHPAYLGMIGVELGTSMMLGSWLAIVPGVVSALLILLRTILEDRFLMSSLAGYNAYAEKTRFRLLPKIW